MTETTLDARGLKCPLPVLRAQKAMQKLAPGDVLCVIATDPGAIRDVDAFCAARGHVLLERSEDGEELRFRIRKAG
jgi:tRNA 2-thiouridine synthesizing protein A